MNGKGVRSAGSARGAKGVAVEPEGQAMRKARHLPMFGPGLEITVPLGLLPAYLELYHLTVLPKREVQPAATLRLLVRRDALNERKA